MTASATHGQAAVQDVDDARTAPVATNQVIANFTKEELAAWRVADIGDRPSAEKRNLDIGFPVGQLVRFWHGLFRMKKYILLCLPAHKNIHFD